MANALQLRRGTTTQHSTFTGLAGEVTVDTTKDTVVVHDGATAGGIPLATEDSVSASNLLTAIKTVDGAGSGLDADLLDGQTGTYYTNYADTAVANLVASAPSTLDTLNELAAALGDDPNFATTVTNSIATKLSTSGGTINGQLVVNTASDNKMLLKTPSGDSSDWNYIEFYGRDNVRDGYVGTDGGGTVQVYCDSTGSYLELGTTPTINAHTVWTAGNDGSGSGLDADTVDGIQGSSIVQTSDSRLTNSRQCNNSFDNITTSRNNLGLGTGNSVTFAGITSNGSVDVNGTLEIEEVSEKFVTSASTSGTATFNTSEYGVLYYTANQTANRTINFINVNSRILVGQSVTCSVLMTQGSTAYYLNAYQVDGTAVTPKWSGGSAPTGGNASGIDVYTFTIIKTANATFTVLASLTQYA